jgi:hypothetical protein
MMKPLPIINKPKHPKKGENTKKNKEGPMSKKTKESPNKKVNHNGIIKFPNTLPPCKKHITLKR